MQNFWWSTSKICSKKRRIDFQLYILQKEQKSIKNLEIYLCLKGEILIFSVYSTKLWSVVNLHSVFKLLVVLLKFYKNAQTNLIQFPNFTKVLSTIWFPRVSKLSIPNLLIKFLQVAQLLIYATILKVRTITNINVCQKAFHSINIGFNFKSGEHCRRKCSNHFRKIGWHYRTKRLQVPIKTKMQLALLWLELWACVMRRQMKLITAQ